jgi:Protein of unknown function (DUF1761)
MREISINFLALLVAAIAKLAVGSVWYSPVLFAKPWRDFVGVSEAEMKAGLAKAMGVDFIASLVMAFVLVHAVVYAGAVTASQGVIVGFFNWLGFVAAVTLPQVFYERRPLKLFLINNGYLLISLVIMGAILAVWR